MPGVPRHHKNIPRGCHLGGLFWHCCLGIAVLTSYLRPSSHLQSISTNSPAVTDIKKARNISTTSPPSLKSSGVTGKYIVPSFQCQCQVSSECNVDCCKHIAFSFIYTIKLNANVRFCRNKARRLRRGNMPLFNKPLDNLCEKM